MGKLENRVSMSRSRANRDISRIGENSRTYQATFVRPVVNVKWQTHGMDRGTTANINESIAARERKKGALTNFKPFVSSGLEQSNLSHTSHYNLSKERLTQKKKLFQTYIRPFAAHAAEIPL